MDLTRVFGTYSRELRINCGKIKELLADDSVDTEQMIKEVEVIIEPAFIEFDAKPRFVKNLHACTSKLEVDKLCRAAVYAGMKFKGIPDLY
jgi:hypothetical protein